MTEAIENIFLGTAGMSPQVITESLYAIATDVTGQYHWPHELRVITTVTGARKVEEGLLRDNHLRRLCRELGKPEPRFDPAEHILVIEDANGSPIDDARSVEDHNAVANFIMTQVRELTAREDGSLHASLAGGRKTMTFYMGYAMSLFGRSQDCLSHVLVDDGFESSQDFWFPTQADGFRNIHNRGRTLDASTARVTLADIPFIRQRHNLPQYLKNPGQNGGVATGGVDFVRLVRLINLGDQPERVRVRLDTGKRQIIVHDEHSSLEEAFEPSLIEFAYYFLMAGASKEGNPGLRRPTERAGVDSMAVAYLRTLLAVCLPDHQQLSQGTPETWVKELKAWSEKQERPPLQDRTLDALVDRGMQPQWFDDRKQKLKSMFSSRLPANLVERIGVAIVFDVDGNRARDGEARQSNGGYGLPLAPEAIELGKPL